MKRRLVRMWGPVMLIGFLTVVGLLSALFGDGAWDLFSAVTLGVPVAAAGWFSLARRSKGGRLR